MKIDFPTHFTIDYPEENKEYYSNSEDNSSIRELLLNASKGYCMYCGRKIITDNEEFGHLEHSVDKDGNLNQELISDSVLKECKFNIAISCPKCNLVYKKKIKKLDVSPWKDKKCPPTCSNICPEYSKMRDSYTEKNQLILQPVGYEIDGCRCEIDYNLLMHLYEPGEGVSNPGLQFLIGNHIERFDLNGDRFSYVLIDICENIVDFCYMGVRDKKRVLSNVKRQQYENVIGIQFIEFLNNYFSSDERSIDELYDFCKMLIIMDSVV